MGKYRILLWDVDDTLLDFKESERHAFFTTCERFKLEADESRYLRYSAINDARWKQLEKGLITKEEVVKGRFTEYFAEYGITGIDVNEFQPVFQDGLAGVFYYKEHSDELIRELRDKGYRQYLVTNGVIRTQERKLRLAGFYDLVDGVFISEQIGFNKPDARYFEAVFAQIPDFDREAAILIGDSLTSDMQGGRNAGVTTCRYCPDKDKDKVAEQKDARVDYEIHSLWDIRNIL